jgi:hypothetical protein
LHPYRQTPPDASRIKALRPEKDPTYQGLPFSTLDISNIIYYIFHTFPMEDSSMGKNISIYIDDDQLNILKKKKSPVSKIIREALNLYFQKDSRKAAGEKVLALSKQLSKEHDFDAIIKELEKERSRDRW